MELRTVSRYVNQGINKISVVQELADFFALEFEDFFQDLAEHMKNGSVVSLTENTLPLFHISMTANAA